ncbi:ImmA/IrrE family metallo-endopeptidase [Spirulina sp. CS-785/01]|uniref:ImmA/IrrE family metallo-endopeptidase n=1 Tax=Spirulina sp. CS-785/01 TaxID=3021716 RepID=UPI002330FACA|nr:ImmA/IrrE family metallo-endopeptidase [Spirulina sp. CS-785/01]MDB9315105.1 ImmA/IrrE family metallo-endopeptidase [Spirulina sp. CS-785/01]
MGIIKPFRFISKHEIECRALDILEAMKQTPQYQPQFPLDASWVGEFLGLDIVWDTIPDDDLGQIAARILPLDRLIEINENIPQLRGGFGESTIAHEIGHWVLHIDQFAVERLHRLRKQGVYMAVDPLLCRSEDELQGIEWQAQYFASCLLMPRYLLEEKRQQRDLTQWRDLYRLAEDCGVTISNLLHRLRDLQWIEEGERLRSKSY